MPILSRGYDEAKALVEQVRGSLGIEPRAVTHNILLDALLKATRIDEALEYFYDVVAMAGTSTFPPSPQSLSSAATTSPSSGSDNKRRRNQGKEEETRSSSRVEVVISSERETSHPFLFSHTSHHQVGASRLVEEEMVWEGKSQ